MKQYYRLLLAGLGRPSEPHANGLAEKAHERLSRLEGRLNRALKLRFQAILNGKRAHSDKALSLDVPDTLVVLAIRSRIPRSHP